MPVLATVSDATTPPARTRLVGAPSIERLLINHVLKYGDRSNFLRLVGASRLEFLQRLDQLVVVLSCFVEVASDHERLEHSILLTLCALQRVSLRTLACSVAARRMTRLAGGENPDT